MSEQYKMDLLIEQKKRFLNLHTELSNFEEIYRTMHDLRGAHKDPDLKTIQDALEVIEGEIQAVANGINQLKK